MPTLIRSEGQQCHTDQALYNPETMQVHLCSMLGPREATRAVWAKAVLAKPAEIYLDGAWHKIKFSDMTMKTSKLPCGRTHQLVISKAALANDVALARSEAELMDRIWLHVSRTARVPLHGTWRDWTLQNLNLTRLTGIGSLCGAVIDGIDELQEKVCSAIKAEVLCV